MKNRQSRLVARSVVGVAVAATLAAATLSQATSSSASPSPAGRPSSRSAPVTSIPPSAGWGVPNPPPRGGRPHGLVVPRNPRNAIRGSYIVVLRDQRQTREQAIRLLRYLIRAHGGRSVLLFAVVLRAFLFRGSAARAARIASDPRVAYVEQDRKVWPLDMPLSGSQSNPPSWGLDRIDQRSEPLDHRYTYPSVNNAVDAYVIDSGVRITHREIQGRATWAANFAGDGKNYDCSGHGTHVAGTIAGSTVGVAKSARIVALKVFGCSGSGLMSNVLRAVDWVTANGHRPAVVNMSLGADGNDPALVAGIQKSVQRGYNYAVAAGNSHMNACEVSPALSTYVITVGATTSSDSRDTSYSNYGKCVNIFAPGTNIYSASYQSDTAYSTMSGTSMASPHVAGAEALVLGQNPNYSPRQVADCLSRDATQGQLSSVGSGSPNRLLHVSADYRGCAG
jgi:subtilisin family serine protease